MAGTKKRDQNKESPTARDGRDVRFAQQFTSDIVMVNAFGMPPSVADQYSL